MLTMIRYIKLREPEAAWYDLGLVSCLVMEIFNRKTTLCEWMKLIEEDFNKCISTVASLFSVD